jgi:hypothetical protein
LGRAIHSLDAEEKEAEPLSLLHLRNFTFFSFEEDAMVDPGVEHAPEDAYYCK